MPTRVQLPDGNVGEFPDNMSQQQIEAVLAKQFPASNQPPGVPKAPIPAGLQGPPTPTKQYGLTESHPVNDLLSGASNFGAGVLNGIKNLPQAVIAPLKMLTAGNPGLSARDVFTQPPPGSQIPQMAQEARQFVHDVKTNPAQTLTYSAGNLAGQTALTGGMEELAPIGMRAAGKVGSSLRKAAITHLMDPLRDYRSPAISTQEAIGRRTTDILHPHPAAYRGVSSAITENAPYIKDFAQSTGNKLGTPLDFAKASTGAGQEASNFFKENLIDPNAELQTPHGTIGEVHQRLGEINDELRPAYRQRTGGQELTALERKNLETERDQLNDTLYGTLSERSGLPVEQIQAINQRGGALQHVGDEADAAQAMRRAGFSGYTPNGLPMPFTAMERGMRLLNYVRGGQERVAGRQLGRVFNQVGSPAEPLPDPKAINNYRQMAEQSDLGNMSRTIERQNQNRAASIERQNQNLAASMARKPAGMGPTQPPQAETMSPEPQLRIMADKLASRRANMTQQREIQQAASEAERQRQNQNRAASEAERQRQAENYATRGTRLERLRQKLKEQ